MKQSKQLHILPYVTLGACAAGAGLRFWLYGTGVDEKGLLVVSHPANALTFILCALAIGWIAWSVRSLGNLPSYSQLFPRSLLAAIGNVAAAAGILTVRSSAVFLETDMIITLSRVVGVLSAVSLVYLGWCRFRQLRPSFLLHCIVTVYFMLHMVAQYRLWSAEPQLQNYCFALLASVLLMLTFYHRAGLDTKYQSRRAYVFFNQAALLCCCLSLNGRNWIFYLSMAIWTATNLCSLKSTRSSSPAHKQRGMVLPESVLLCIRTLEEAGFSAYAVGGCVRDDILGLTPHDYDLCTNATPEQICQVFSAYPQVRSGEKHGTIGVILNSGVFEITTFRTEGGYADSRHPDWVKFVPTVQQDLSRRDFTVNAMAYAPGKGLVDPWGGSKDLNDRILRTVGDPTARFTEDPLRILRGIRFAVRYSLTPEPETLKAMQTLAPLLDKLARERVFDELCKLLPRVQADDLLRYSPILVHAIPELKASIGFQQHNPHHKYDVFTHTAHVVAAVPKALPLRWAALLHDIGKPSTFTTDKKGQGHFYGHAKVSAEMANEILLRLRASNTLRQQVVFLIEHHMTLLVPDKKLLRRRMGQYGPEAIGWLLALQKADFEGTGTRNEKNNFDQVEALLEALLKEGTCLTVRDLAINGRDILSLNVTPGPQVGACMTHLLAQVQDEIIPNTRDALLDAAKAFLKTH